MSTSEWPPNNSFTQLHHLRNNVVSDEQLRHTRSLHQRERSQAKLAAFYEPTGPPAIIIPEEPIPDDRDYIARKSSSAERGLALLHLARSVEEHSPKIGFGNKKQKKLQLDLSQLFPSVRSGTRTLLSPSKVAQSPTAMTDVSDTFSHSGTRPVQSTTKPSSQSAHTASPRSVGTTRSQPLERDMQTKTHVRRPPKGIQNWFDAYQSSDEDNAEDDIQVIRSSSLQSNLPALISEKSAHFNLTQPMTLVEDVEATIQRARERLGLRKPEQRTAQQTPSPMIPPRRTSIRKGQRTQTDQMAAAHTMLSSSSTLEELDTSMGDDHIDRAYDQSDAEHSRHEQTAVAHDSQLQGGREDYEASAYSTPTSMPTPIARKAHLQWHESADVEDPHEDSVQQGHQKTNRNPRREHNLSMVSKATGTTFQDVTPLTPTSAAHIMAVTDEEKALLDMMRQKRAAMQQISFTEGYQTALRRAQPRRRHSRPSSFRSSMHEEEFLTSPSEHSTQPTSHDEQEMRRQLKRLQKQDVDEQLKMARYLDSQEPYEVVDMMPMELPSSKPKRSSRHVASKADTRPISTPEPFIPGEYIYEDTEQYLADREARHVAKQARRQSKRAIPPSSHSIDRSPVAFQTFTRNASKLNHGKPQLKEPSRLQNDISAELLVDEDDAQLDRYGDQIQHAHISDETFVDDQRRAVRLVYQDRDTLKLLTNHSTLMSPIDSEGASSPASLPMASANSDPPQQLEHKDNGPPIERGMTRSPPQAGPSRNPSEDILPRTTYQPEPTHSPKVNQEPAFERPSEQATVMEKTKSTPRIPSALTSPRTINSASEEILAAWADLGGGRDTYRGAGGC